MIVGGTLGKDRGVSFTSTLPTFKRQIKSPFQTKAIINPDNKW
jgi:hypothetical protein